jgi:hypothetical protein
MIGRIVESVLVPKGAKVIGKGSKSTMLGDIVAYVAGMFKGQIRQITQDDIEAELGTKPLLNPDGTVKQAGKPKTMPGSWGNNLHRRIKKDLGEDACEFVKVKDANGRWLFYITKLTGEEAPADDDTETK